MTHLLCGQLRGGVGLPTRVSAVDSLLRLMETSSLVFKSYDGALARVVFDSCLSVLLQNSLTSSGLKSSMLQCLAVAGISSGGDYLSGQLLLLTSRYSDNFTEKYDCEDATVIANCLGHIIRRGGDQLDFEVPVWEDLLCCSYVGSFSMDEDVAKAWMIVWNESLTHSGEGTKYSALKKVLSQVKTKVCALLRSLSWTQRKIGISLLKDIVLLFPLDQLRNQLYDMILSLFWCIKYRIWNGQHEVLEAIVFICEKYRDLYIFEESKWEYGVAEAPSASRSSFDCESTGITESKDFQYVRSEKILASKGPNHEEAIIFEVNCFGLVELLLCESLRGDKQYKYSAAKALSEMRKSWRDFAVRCPHKSLYYLDIIIRRAGIFFDFDSTGNQIIIVLM